MSKKNVPQRDKCAESFEESLDELEAIVTDLETGKLGLSDALARYEQGVGHLRVCQQLLERAERKIEVLSGLDADGNPISEPFDDREASSLEEKAAARAERRTRGGKPFAGGSAVVNSDDIDDAQRLF
jgi:exodeoxyribonuclease VII small subunit